jgi:signal transduction histidine kinase
VALAGLRANELARLSEFTHIADDPTRKRYAELVTGPDVETANALRDAVLSSAGSPASLEVDADAWYIAQSGAMRGMRTVQLELTTSLARTAQRQQSNAETRAVLAGFIAAVVVLGTLIPGILLAVRTTRRLRRLRQTALAVARSELPIAVSQVATAGTSEVVRGAIGSSHRRVASMMDTGVDEVAEVSAAIGVVHQQALRLAAEQALLRLEVSALFVALSRRGQSLVHRQLQLIDEFERTEEDPDNLARLFALDHLAARMRRNEENLLVLAGGEPGRRFERPVVLTDVIRAAAAEIEDYKRVDAPSAEDVWVAANAVGDVIHLLAELLDNAAAFSPPSSRVRVTVVRGGDSVTVSVVDSGIGMSDEQLVEGNRRLTRPAVLTSALVGTMGLLVVARLATRRGVRVKLLRNAAGGTTAEVRLHTAVLVDALPRAIPRPVRAAVAAPALSVSAPRMAPPVSAPPVSAPPVSAPPVSVPPVRLRTPPVQITLFAAPTASPAASGPTPVSAPPTRKKVPAAEEAVTAAGEPVADGLPGRTPVTVPASAAPDPPRQSQTAAGLPMRRPGAHVDGTAAAQRTPDDVFLDPETVRARLTSLAGGIAAAKRIVEAPPGASPME